MNEVMLKSLTLKNFRAFKAQKFDFGRINLFVGPNNSGKSSAISAINLLAQTVSNNEFGSSSLLLNGEFDKLGTFLDLVHGRRSNTPLVFEFSYDSFDIKLEYKYRPQRREIEIVSFELYDNSKQMISFTSKNDSFEVKILGRRFETNFPGIRKRRPSFRSIIPSGNFIHPVLLDRDRDRENVLSPKQRQILTRAERSLMRARVGLRRIFDNFDSLSPFRERPDRTYMYTGETTDKIGATGGNVAGILSGDSARRGSESRRMADEISRWFDVAGIAKGVSVRNLTPRHYELVVEDYLGDSYNICDVGFGCSQVLPVLVASLNLFNNNSSSMERSRPILIVQEPEIHLHPNAQAALGSFFSGVVPKNGQLFIETHSDNLGNYIHS